MSFAKKELSGYDTSTVCRVLRVSKSGYYKHIAKSESEKTEAENKVINCFKRHSGNYGRIRIRKALLDEGVDISEYKIAKILKDVQRKRPLQTRLRLLISKCPFLEVNQENLLKHIMITPTASKP